THGPDDLILSRSKCDALLPGPGVPQLEFGWQKVLFIGEKWEGSLAAAGEGLAVGAEGHAIDETSGFLEGKSLLSGLRIPQLDRLVPAARGQRLAVRTEGHGSDNPCMPLEGEPLLSGLCVPQRNVGCDGSFPQAGTAAGKRFTVRTEAYGRNG